MTTTADSPLPQAVCVLIIRNDGHALAVSRRKDPTKWGLPGGKVDPGETLQEAIVRETREEIGLTMDINKLTFLYQAPCPGEVSYDVTTFFYDVPGPDIEDLTPEADLSLSYHDFSVLMMEDSSPFAGYNRGVMKAFTEQFVEQMTKTLL